MQSEIPKNMKKTPLFVAVSMAVASFTAPAHLFA
ncbi:MAG: hypothetical protein ACJASY_001352, partial [Halioglobus sp.]